MFFSQSFSFLFCVSSFSRLWFCSEILAVFLASAPLMTRQPASVLFLAISPTTVLLLLLLLLRCKKMSDSHHSVSLLLPVVEREVYILKM